MPKRFSSQVRDDTGRLFCNPDRPWFGTSCSVAVTDPETHPKSKARPVQSQFFWNEPSAVQSRLKEERKLKEISKIVSGSLAAQLETKKRTGPLADQ